MPSRASGWAPGRPPGSAGTPARRAWRAGLAARLLVVLLVAWPHALAQAGADEVVSGLALVGVSYVGADSLAVALGDVVNKGGGILTWHGAEGVVTFFAGSADALLQRPGNAGPDEWVLSAPVLDDAPSLGWALPLDAVQLLGVAFAGSGGDLRLHAPEGEVYSLVLTTPPPAPQRAAGRDDRAGDGLDGGVGDAVGDGVGGGAGEGAGAGVAAAGVADGWEMADIDGVPALRFFAAPDKSLLLVDLDLAPLAFPAATAAIDEAVATAGADNALLLVVSALSEQSWSSSLVFAQDGHSIEVRHPYRLRVFKGDPGTVGPAASVAAVVLLPASFSLYRPITVAWEAIDATVTFRR